MGGPVSAGGHVFVSYVREDARRVDRLHEALEAAGIRVWRDTADLWPGQDWRLNIRRAITDGALAFLVCFSQEGLSRSASYQNEELTVAIEQLRMRPHDASWLIPIRLDVCEIPDRDIGGNRTLQDLQRVDLFGDSQQVDIERLVQRIRQLTVWPKKPGSGPDDCLRRAQMRPRSRSLLSSNSASAVTQELLAALGPMLSFGGGLESDVLRAPARLAPCQLPSPEPGFAGRVPECAFLEEFLDPAQMPMGPVCAVIGLAGVGKTALAVQAGHAARERGWFPGGVLFVDLHGYDDEPVQAAGALDALLRALGVDAKDIPPSVDERAGLYRSVLAQTAEPVLVIADGVSSVTQVRPLLPGTVPHLVLVTSRHTLAGLSARLLDLTVMAVEDSVGLLDSALHAARPGDNRISADPSSAVRLAAACGGLPLALRIVASILASQLSLSPAELADDVALEAGRLDRLAYSEGAESDAQSVTAAFDLSYRQLDKEPARLFRLLAVAPGLDFSTGSASVLALQPASRTGSLLAVLARAHLIEQVPGTQGRWRMHDLVRLYCKHISASNADTDNRQRAAALLLKWFAVAAHDAMAYVDAVPQDDAQRWFGSLQEAQAWLDAERCTLIAAVESPPASGEDVTVALLAEALSMYLERQRRFGDLLAVSTAFLTTARYLAKTDSEAAALVYVGSAMRGLWRPAECITALERAVQICRETGDHEFEAVVLTDLSFALTGSRRFDQAIAASQNAAAIYRETGDRAGEAASLLAEGIVLRESRQLDRSTAAFMAAVTIYRELGDHGLEGVALTNYGIVLTARWRIDEAISVGREAAALCSEGGDLHATAAALVCLATALRGARRFGEAVTADRDAAMAYRQVGDWHAEGCALAGLGAALNGERRYEEAVANCREAAMILRNVGDKRSEAEAMQVLSTSLGGIMRFDEAIEACQAAVGIFRETGDWYAEGIALVDLGHAFSGARRFEEAANSYQNAAAILQATDDRHTEGLAMAGLGASMSEIGQFGQAIAACEDAVAIFAETGDRKAEGDALSRLGVAFAGAQQHERAMAAHQNAITIFREVGDTLGEGMSLDNLGCALSSARQVDGAVAAHQLAATIFREAGDRHSEGVALANLGATLGKGGRIKKAIMADKRAVEIFRETGDRLLEAMALNNLGGALRVSRRPMDAITAHENAAAIYRDASDRQREGTALVNLGAALRDARRYDKAIASAQAALAIFRTTGNRTSEATALTELGLDLFRLRQFQDAAAVHSEALTIYREVGDDAGERNALANIKRAQSHIGHQRRNVPTTSGL